MILFKDTFKNKKVLITGHSGFKGSWLSLWLKKLGAEVYGLSNGIPTKPSNFEALSLDKEIDNIFCDVKEYGKLKKIIHEINPDFVFHLAAQSIVGKSFKEPLETFCTNTLGTINLLESLLQLTKQCTAIIITSDKCYENKEWIWGYRENDLLGGKDPYSASKAAAEIAIRSYFYTFFKSNSPIRIGITRAGNVIGGGDWASGRLVPDCMRSWSRNESVKIKNPTSTRPWQHVLEPLSGYLLLAQNLNNENTNLNGDAFNFGPSNSQNKNVGDVVSYMSEIWQGSKWEITEDKSKSFKECSLLKLNCDKAIDILGWSPVWDYKATILETVNWYKNFYLEKDLSPREFSLNQISYYEELASKKGLLWTIE